MFSNIWWEVDNTNSTYKFNMPKIDFRFQFVETDDLHYRILGHSKFGLFTSDYLEELCKIGVLKMSDVRKNNLNLK